MKAIDLRKMFVPLLVGSALFASSLPAMADRVYRSYEPRKEYGDYGKHQHKHAYKHHRSQSHYAKRHYYQPGNSVVYHHYYYPPAPRYSPPPRVRYSYHPGVVVSLPPIVIKLK